MLRYSSPFWSSTGKKILMALTGLLLSAFLVVHLAGNLTLYTGNPEHINLYAHFLEKFGWVIKGMELGLALLFLVHMTIAIILTLKNWQARPVGYRKVKGAGHTSRKSLGSSTMIYTGLLVIIFVIIHLANFKYGPGVEEGYVMTIHGENVWNLHRVVADFFHNGWNVLFYTVIMLLLGIHLSHGFWSAFQSLGLGGKRFTPFIYAVGILFALLIGAGFFFIPVWMFITG